MRTVQSSFAVQARHRGSQRESVIVLILYELYDVIHYALFRLWINARWASVTYFLLGHLVPANIRQPLTPLSLSKLSFYCSWTGDTTKQIQICILCDCQHYVMFTRPVLLFVNRSLLQMCVHFGSCVSACMCPSLYTLCLDCDNFWHKRCQESRQSKYTLFSHHT